MHWSVQIPWYIYPTFCVDLYRLMAPTGLLIHLSRILFGPLLDLYGKWRTLFRLLMGTSSSFSQRCQLFCKHNCLRQYRISTCHSVIITLSFMWMACVIVIYSSLHRNAEIFSLHRIIFRQHKECAFQMKMFYIISQCVLFHARVKFVFLCW